MTMQNVNIVAAGVKESMIKAGLAPLTIQNHYYNFYNPIWDFIKSECDGQCSIPSLQMYLDRMLKIAKENGFSKKRTLSIKRAVQTVIDFINGQDYDWKYQKRGYVYLPSPKGMLFFQSVIEFAGYTEDTIPNQESAIIRRFICFLENDHISIDKITDILLIDFMKSSESYTSCKSYLIASIDKVSKYLKSNNLGDVTLNFSKIRIPTQRKRVIEPYSKDEIRLILSSIKRDTVVGSRDYAVLILAYATGLRAVDISNITFSSIDWKKAKLSFLQQKTSVSEIFPLDGAVLNAIAEYIINFRPKSDSEYIFLTSRAPFRKLDRGSVPNILRKYCERCGIEFKQGRCFHSLRRSFATGLSEKEVPVTTISQLLGQRNINSSKPYLSYNTKQMLRCALNFDDIPISDGIYHKVKGGDADDGTKQLNG